MIPWGAIIGLAGQVASGIMSSKNNREAREMQQQQYEQQRAYLTAKMNEDPLKRSENVSLLNRFDRDAKEEMDKVDATGKILGATPEYSLAARKQIAGAKQDLMSGILEGESARRDKLQDSINTLDTNKAKADLAMHTAMQEQYANLAANAASAAGSLIDGMGYGKSSGSGSSSGSDSNSGSGSNDDKSSTSSAVTGGANRNDYHPADR